MTSKNKIINDPVLGFVSLPYPLLYDLLQHPFVQRLTRIRQLGLSYFVYPGNTHTRFIHSLGAMHLTHEAIRHLRSRGNDITPSEEEATLAAVLLHDIGHGPFSHALEHVLIPDVNHEDITLLLTRRINDEPSLKGRLDLAIEIFTDRYPKHYLHQLISSQLDMDRMDYLVRDSFFSGVREGNVGAERLIKMLNVKDDRLVVEEKGIYSAENFLIARRLMYWQVYLHKTAVASETMLRHVIIRAKYLTANGESLFASPSLQHFLRADFDLASFASSDETVRRFARLDDADVLSSVKEWQDAKDTVLSVLCKGLTNRRLFKVRQAEDETELKERQEQLLECYTKEYGISPVEAALFLSCGPVRSRTYDPSSDNILILHRDGSVNELSDVSDVLKASQMLSQRTTHYFLSYLPTPLFSEK
ncbi:MAG: HD domain-containing protein [Paludibacteraceae bacterium]|nr:HD domain-containing protein [Paludibacteraceae bacterium]